MGKRHPTGQPTGALYLSPLGRVCELMPAPPHGIGSDGLTYSFAYVRANGRRHTTDGFNLSQGNVHHMRQVLQG